MVNSWSDHRGNWCGAGFLNGTPTKNRISRCRVTVVGAERSIQQSCGCIRADAAERRSSANNIIADLGQKCNPKNQHGRKTRAAGHTGPKNSRNRQTAPDSRAARCGGDGRRFASRCGRWYNTMQTLYFLPRRTRRTWPCCGAGICCAGDPDRKEPFHDPHCHCRG